MFGQSCLLESLAHPITQHYILKPKISKVSARRGGRKAQMMKNGRKEARGHKLTNMPRGMPDGGNVLRMRFSQNNSLKTDQVLGARAKLITTQNIYRIFGYGKIFRCGVFFRS